MKKIINLCFTVIIFLSGCKQSVNYELKFSKDLYKPEAFNLSCNNIFDKSNSFVNIDSFRMNIHSTNYKFNKYPIYNHCENSDSFNQFFSRNQKDNYFPFFVGQIINTPLELLTFNRYDGDRLIRAVSYASLKKQDEYLFFEVFDSFMDEGKFFETYIHKDYLLLWQYTDSSYDIVDNRMPKKIKVKFCVLKITKDNKVLVLSENEGLNVLKNKFFAGIPEDLFNE